MASTPNPDTPKLAGQSVSPGHEASVILARHLDPLRERNGGIVRLVQFAHDSVGLRAYKARIADALVYCLESNGYVITRADPTAVPTSE